MSGLLNRRNRSDNPIDAGLITWSPHLLSPSSHTALGTDNQPKTKVDPE